MSIFLSDYLPSKTLHNSIFTCRILRSIILCSVVSARTISRDSFKAWSLCTNPLLSPKSFSTSSSSWQQIKPKISFKKISKVDPLLFPIRDLDFMLRGYWGKGGGVCSSRPLNNGSSQRLVAIVTCCWYCFWCWRQEVIILDCMTWSVCLFCFLNICGVLWRTNQQESYDKCWKLR